MVRDLSSNLSDFINEVLRDKIRRWRGIRVGFQSSSTGKSGNGKLQGAGVRIELLHRNAEFFLYLGAVVAKIDQASEFVLGSIIYELVEVSCKRCCPVTEGILAITGLITADRGYRASV